MKFIGWVCISKHNDQWSVEISRTVNFKLICKSIPLKLVPITFQE